jgi:hypothetical protein
MKESKEKKITTKEACELAVKGALITSKHYQTCIGLLYHTRMFLLWLLNYASESELTKAILKTETGIAIRPSKGSIVPANYLVTCAVNTTGRAETVRVFDNYGQFTGLRVAFASPKFHYQGFNMSEKLCKEVSTTLGLPESEVMQVRQGNKNYFWNSNFSLLQAYCLAKFRPESENK